MTATAAATFWPALSSDARMVVYVSDAGKDGESPQVWLQQVGGAAVQLTSGQRDCAEPTFSGDDTRVLFTATGESTRNVYEIPTLGGQPRLVRRAARNAKYSPDGKWLAYIAIGARDSLRVVPTDGGAERTLATDLVDIACATWSDDGRHLLVVAHPDPSVELDCWIVPLEGGAPLDTGVMKQGRQQGLLVIRPSPAWEGDSVFYTAAGRQGVQIWRQRVSPQTFDAIGAPEAMTPGGDYAFFPSVTRGHLCFVGTHADVNLWSVAIDAGHRHGPWSAASPDTRRRHRQSPDPVAGRPDARAFWRRHDRQPAPRQESGKRFRLEDRGRARCQPRVPGNLAEWTEAGIQRRRARSARAASPVPDEYHGRRDAARPQRLWRSAEAMAR